MVNWYHTVNEVFYFCMFQQNLIFFFFPFFFIYFFSCGSGGDQVIVNGIRFKNLKHQNLALCVSLHKSCRQQVEGTRKWLTSHLTRNITMDFCRMVWPSASPKFAKSPKRCRVVLDLTTSQCNENNAKEQQQKSHKYTQHSALYVCLKKNGVPCLRLTLLLFLLQFHST